MDLLTLGENVVKKALTKKLGSIEVFLLRRKTISVAILNNEIERCEKILDEGAAIRLIKNGSISFSSTACLDIDAIMAAVQQASSFVPLNSQDSYFFRLPEPKKPPCAVEGFDKKLAELDARECICLSKQLVEAAKDVVHRSLINASLFITSFNFGVTNSEGISVSDKGTIFVLNCYVTVKDTGNNVSHFFKRSEGRTLCSLKPGELGEKCAREASKLLKGKTLKTQRLITILLPQFVARLFLYAFGYGANARFALTNQSFLSKKENDKISTDKLTVIDDGLLPNCIGTSSIDAEGVPRQRTVIINNGILKSYLYDSYTAAFRRSSSTGNASRGGHIMNYRASPNIWYTNIVVKEGGQTLAELIEGVDKGILCLNTLDFPNPISGHFVGRIENAFKIDKGEVSHPVRGATIKFNLSHMLKTIDEIGKERETVYGITTPAFKLNNLIIIGS